MKNILILHKAITELPTYQARDTIWPHIEQALDAQEAYSFPDAVALDTHLTQVQANLQSLEQQQQTTFKQAIRQLPTYHAAPDVFTQIVTGTGKKPGRNRQLWYWASGIAASILLLMTFIWIYKPTGNSAHISITYSQETLPSLHWEQTGTNSSNTDDIFSFIQAHCMQIALKCEEPQFKRLYEEYMQLQEAKHELESQLKIHQPQPELVRYLIRIEKQQTEVGKQLIQQLIG